MSKKPFSCEYGRYFIIVCAEKMEAKIEVKMNAELVDAYYERDIG